jgi:hypothetical protein
MTRVLTSDLDFFSIKESLKTYLRNTTEFQDYDFEGSGLSALLDVLAHNTHMNALISNFALNESFLDTAQLRSSVVSHSKALGYLPRSRVSSAAELQIQIVGYTPGEVAVLPKYTEFTSTVDGVLYTFYTLDEYQAVDGAFSSVLVYEGKKRTKRFIVDSSPSEYPTYIIPDKNLYVDSGSCSVLDTLTSTSQTAFRRVETLDDLGPEETGYYVFELPSGEYGLLFGDGVAGVALEPGSVIVYTYLSSSGPASEGAIVFGTSATVNGKTLVVGTTTRAVGGSEKESIASIAANAPRAFAAQARAVTKQDYVTLISAFAPYAEAINVWGGEDNDPPAYGKVFIAIKPTGRDTLTDVEKSQLLAQILTKKTIGTIEPEIIDPVYQDIEVRVNVTYDSDKTILSEQQVESAAKQAIIDYGDANLLGFDSALRKSRLLAYIDSTVPAAINSSGELRIQRRFSPVLASAGRYEVLFTAPFANPTSKRILESERFQYTIEGVSYDCFLRNKEGTYQLEIYRFSNTGEVIVVDNAGSIDPNTSIVTISPFAPSNIPNPALGLRLTASVASDDKILSKRNVIIRIDPNFIFVDASTDG